MIADNCASCAAWDQLERHEFGRCHKRATPAAPIDGMPAWRYPIRRGTSICPHYSAQPDSALALRRQADVRRAGEDRAA